ncbi:MAG TPA: hypothetical protein VGR27_02825, partial [Longimicrobiaceae bacterium]|nr:hypothetical protein [Longimicrobiaceae bacterium]
RQRGRLILYPPQWPELPMGKILKTFVIIAAVFFAGRWGVEHFMEFVDARYAEREEMARQIGAHKGEQIKRTIEAGQAVRAEALREQPDADHALRSTAPPRAVNTQPLRGQLEAAGAAAQSRHRGGGAAVRGRGWPMCLYSPVTTGAHNLERDLPPCLLLLPFETLCRVTRSVRAGASRSAMHFGRQE